MQIEKPERSKRDIVASRENNDLFTNVRLMTSFLKHHQRPTDYTIEHQQLHSGTKYINIIV